jgi:hypothetical protein
MDWKFTIRESISANLKVDRGCIGHAVLSDVNESSGVTIHHSEPIVRIG